MILIILGIIFLAWCIFKLAPYRKLKGWDETKCCITKSESEQFEEPQVSVKIDFIRPVIEYCYSYQGEKFMGNVISLEEHSLKAFPNSENLFWAKWPKGKHCPVYVNPSNPHEALLFREILPNRKNHYASLLFTGLLLIMIGSLVLYVQP